MEEKLEQYRRRKRTRAIIMGVSNLVDRISLWKESAPQLTMTDRVDQMETDIKETMDKDIEEEKDKEEVEEKEEQEEEIEQINPIIKWLTYFLYFLLWATLYAIAIRVEFGAVYFIVSTLFLIYCNTRTKPKKPGEISAYSVFNPNCEAIDGTLNAEQFEREIRFGSMSVR